MTDASAVAAPEELTVTDPDGLVSVVHRWRPTGGPRAVVHVLHGWGEHALRYDRPARAMAAAGFVVSADDHRGHGRTGGRAGMLGDLGPRGADGVLDAVHAVVGRVAQDHPGVPLFLVGHSWGSFILQRYLRRWSAEIDGAVLTGTTYRDPVAPVPAVRASLNERFEPARTPYDWLSRDEAEVDRYVADPLCGFEMMRSSPTAGPTGARPAPAGTVVASLPVLVLNGSDDPIGGDEGARALAEHYRSLGVLDVSVRTYPGARHELLNETNRDEVLADLLTWLDDHLPATTD